MEFSEHYAELKAAACDLSSALVRLDGIIARITRDLEARQDPALPFDL